MIIAESSLQSIDLTTPRRRNLGAQVMQDLGLRILRGDFDPDGRLPTEAALCRDLGVSRSILREAIKGLAAKGLLETRARTGTRVRPAFAWNLLDPDILSWRYATMPRREFFRDLFETRRVIEPAAAELAASKGSDLEIAEIGRACDAMEAADPTTDPAIVADLDFHRGILLACHNPLLLQMGTLIGIGLLTSFRISTDSYDVSLPKHRPVYAAIAARNPTQARAAMLDLLSYTHDFIDGALGGDADTAN